MSSYHIRLLFSYFVQIITFAQVFVKINFTYSTYNAVIQYRPNIVMDAHGCGTFLWHYMESV